MARGGLRSEPYVQDQIFALAIAYKIEQKGNSPSRSQLRRAFMKKYKRSIAWSGFQKKIDRLIERGLLERGEDDQIIVPNSVWMYLANSVPPVAPLP